MLVSHFECIVGQFVVTIGPHLLITDVNPGSKTGKIHVDPIRILGYRVEKAAILDDVCIDGVLETIGIAGAVKCLVFVLGEIDPEIAPAFWRIRTITGLEAKKNQQ